MFDFELFSLQTLLTPGINNGRGKTVQGNTAETQVRVRFKSTTSRFAVSALISMPSEHPC